MRWGQEILFSPDPCLAKGGLPGGDRRGDQIGGCNPLF